MLIFWLGLVMIIIGSMWLGKCLYQRRVHRTLLAGIPKHTSIKFVERFFYTPNQAAFQEALHTSGLFEEYKDAPHNYLAVNREGIVRGFVFEPVFNMGEWSTYLYDARESPMEGIYVTRIQGLEIDDAENWLFKREGEL
jgi:hypothetical protein